MVAMGRQCRQLVATNSNTQWVRFHGKLGTTSEGFSTIDNSWDRNMECNRKLKGQTSKTHEGRSATFRVHGSAFSPFLIAARFLVTMLEIFRKLTCLTTV